MQVGILTCSLKRPPPARKGGGVAIAVAVPRQEEKAAVGCAWSRGSGGSWGGKEDPVLAKILFLSPLKYTEYMPFQYESVEFFKAL